MITIEQIRVLVSTLPGAYEHASYGERPSWRTKRRMFTWVRDDPEALVVWVGSIEERDALIHSDPSKFFITSHYHSAAVVLVNLNAIDQAEAGELIIESFRLRAEPALVSELDHMEKQ